MGTQWQAVSRKFFAWYTSRLQFSHDINAFKLSRASFDHKYASNVDQNMVAIAGRKKRKYEHVKTR